MTSGAPRRTATTCRPEQSYLSHILSRRHVLLHAYRQPALHAYALQCNDDAQAFEEKFDCFAMLPLPARPRAVASRTLALPEAVGGGPGVRALCCQSPRHQYTGAYHIREPRRLAGVAAYKRFTEGGTAQQEEGAFTFELTAVGNDAFAALRPKSSPSFG